MVPRKETLLQKSFRSRKKLLKKPFAQSSIFVREPQSLDESKSIIRELALQLQRVSQNEEHLSNGSEEDYTVAQCQQFILQWADELRNQPQLSVKDKGGRLKTNKPGVWRTGEKQGATESMASSEEKRLKEGQSILSEWASSLKALPQNSVYPGEDVCAVLQELGRQWKRGQLPNILPVMEFIMWSVIREQPQPGTIPQLWLKSKQRYNHTADIILDPKTAHPNIVLSADRKRVRVDKITESKQNCMDGHYRETHKCDDWHCVQGTEGFTSGRHYWEVGVQGKKDWRIGVVKESAPRHGYIDLNAQTGYWTLRMQVGKIKALTVPATEIPYSSDLSRVGVYLDIEEGQLSFYDVERSSHIYTFNRSFTERVYPLFGTVETDRDLIIL
ncbi:zinc-binding protein A33-like [Megalops cyprinoides]|uniref:zinc-binding protein A33-like n=1 Tax=Megalops cyprinoides TaxID=118141 RepID=UPI001863B222|nr:zinc-binding protein A33-like [Megalops cyprinoides]